MARKNITELTEAEVIDQYTSKVFRPVMAETPPIPSTYDGKYVCAVLVATDSQLTETQMDQLETQIESISGVHKAFVLIGPARIPIDRQPADTDLTIKAEAGFQIKPTPTQE